MGRRELAPTAHLGLSFPLPEGAEERPPTPIDLSALGGAELVMQRAWALPTGGSTEVACVRAPAHLWVQGLEGAVLAGASAMVRDRAGLGVLTPGAVESVDGHWEQSFSGRASSPDPLGAAGRHVFGFVDDGTDGMLCTMVCVAPPPAEPCTALVAGLRIEGELEPPPAPGMAAATLAFMAARPRTALAMGGLIVLLVAVVLVLRRPRPAW
ncbi:MAG: hypothetical protein JRI68_17945 [Deltaproteobacteria bacterium]|nr:hypothetical protein [Deltaproteobacteria bacterium]